MLNLTFVYILGKYLLGDSAYPCSNVLITPFRDNGHLTNAQKHFNVKLSSCRVKIEHAFGILKQRFRQLYYCKLRSIEVMCHFIRACCVLHNLSGMEEAALSTEPNFEEIDREENEATGVVDSALGKAIRNDICSRLYQML